jgi:hypothetical protein
MECFAKKADTNNFHPLNYQHLKIAQEKDKTIQNILKMPKTICSQGLPWGRKSYQTSLLQQEDCNTRTVTKTKIPKIWKMIVKYPWPTQVREVPKLLDKTSKMIKEDYGVKA